MTPKERLLKRIGDVNNLDLPRPVVTLEEFFEENQDYGSIGCNLPDPYSPQEFYRFFQRIKSLADVRDVLVEVKQQEAPEDWPYSDTIWFVTSLSEENLTDLFEERIRPDDWLSYPPNYSVEQINCPDGLQVIGAWYD